MLPNEGKLAATFHPKTPGPRQPLARMVMKSMQGDNRRSNTQNQSQLNESDHDSDEDSCSNNSESDDDVDGSATRLPPPENVVSSALNSSSVSPKIQESLSSSRNATQNREGEIFANHSPKRPSQPCKSDSEKDEKGSKIKYTLILPSLVAIVSIFYFANINSTNNVAQPLPLDNEVIKNFEASLNDISSKFKKQHSNIWDEIYAGVVNIVKHPAKRSVIFLFSNHDDPMFCLAKMLGNATKAVLQSDNTLWLAPSDFVNDYGQVIKKFREPIEKQKIVIIENILDINPEAMRAFHNFCDSENPLVRQTIYIITMIVKNFKRSDKPHVIVEEQLRRRLQGVINPDKLQPLITRLTDAAIIPVQPEPDITSCPLRY